MNRSQQGQPPCWPAASVHFRIPQSGDGAGYWPHEFLRDDQSNLVPKVKARSSASLEKAVARQAKRSMTLECTSAAR